MTSSRDIARTLFASVSSDAELRETAAEVLDEVLGAGGVSSWVESVLSSAASELRGQCDGTTIDTASVPFTQEDPESAHRDVITVRWAIEMSRLAITGQREPFAESASGLLAFAMAHGGNRESA